MEAAESKDTPPSKNPSQPDEERYARALSELEELRARLELLPEGPLPAAGTGHPDELMGFGGVKVDGDAISYDDTFDRDPNEFDAALAINGRPASATISADIGNPLPE